MRLQGKVALITGAASGIGQAIAQRFGREGAKLALVDQTQTALNDALSLAGDVTDAALADRAVRETVEKFGRLDILVTAAGISMPGPLTTTSPDDWDRIFAVNVRGTYLFMRAAIPEMAKRGGGSIVTIASQLALSGGGRGGAAYIASKGAIVSLTRTSSVDHARDGIRINSLLPGATETPLFERSLARQPDPAAARERSRTRHAMGRFGKVEEMAAAALYLASDEASFTTGVCLPVDGGWTAA
jgi:NAD(P)-dependent dehydrogenase (short-subunit alcohol dehydrogenase family)